MIEFKVACHRSIVPLSAECDLLKAAVLDYVSLR
jgi:hypothetical protein